MSQQVTVSRRLEFKGDANQEANVRGNFATEKCYIYDDFTGADISTYWTQVEDNGGTVAIGTTAAVAGSGSAVNGSFTITTGGTDDDRGMLYGSLNFIAEKNPVMEARVKISRITLASFGVGFSDAVTEGDNVQPFSVNGTTVTDTASNGAAIVFDTDADDDYFWIVNSNATSQGGNVLGSQYVPVADTYVTLRVAIDSAGNADYFINGVQVGHKALAVAITSAATLCPYVSCINRAGAALVLTCDYIRCWQDR